MPISVDSSGGVALDYSIRNVNKIDNTNNTEIRPEEKQEANKTQTQVRQELPKEEVEALFFNRQDSQLTRDILNTYASSQDSSNEISFTNLDAYEKLLQNTQPEREPEPTQNIQPRPERVEREPEVSTEPVPQREDTRETELAQNTEPRTERAPRNPEVNTEPSVQGIVQPELEPTQNTEPRVERELEVAQEINIEAVPQRVAQSELESEPAPSQNTEPRPETSVEREEEVNTEPEQPTPQSEASSEKQTDDVTNNL